MRARQTPDSRVSSLQSELKWLDARYRRALGRGSDARDTASISAAFDEADRLQREILNGGRRLRRLERELAAEPTAALAHSLQSEERGARTAAIGPSAPGWDAAT